MTREPYARVPRSVIADSRLTERDRRVYEALALFADRHGRCWPKRRQIAELIGVLPRHITSTTSRLCRLGHLEKTGNGGRSRPAQYQLTYSGKGPGGGTLSDPKTPPSTFVGLEGKKGPGGGTVSDKKGPTTGTRSEQTSSTKGTPAKEESLHGSELVRQVMDAYNAELPELPTAKVASAQLAEDVHHLVGKIPAAASLPWWREYFGEVRKSAFLLGRKGEWQAKLPWLVKAENCCKVLNGQYLDSGSARDGGGEDWTRGML